MTLFYINFMPGSHYSEAIQCDRCSGENHSSGNGFINARGMSARPAASLTGEEQEKPGSETPGGINACVTHTV